MNDVPCEMNERSETVESNETLFQFLEEKIFNADRSFQKARGSCSSFDTLKYTSEQCNVTGDGEKDSQSCSTELDAAAADEDLTKLQCYLHFLSSVSETEKLMARPLLEDCGKRLTRIRCLRYGILPSRKAHLLQLAKRVTGTDGYKLQIPDNVDLLGNIWEQEPFIQLKKESLRSKQIQENSLQQTSKERGRPLGCGTASPVSRSPLAKSRIDTSEKHDRSPSSNAEQNNNNGLLSSKVSTGKNNPGPSSIWNAKMADVKTVNRKCLEVNDDTRIQAMEDDANESTCENSGRHSSFQTAKTRLMIDLKKSGNHAAAANLKRSTGSNVNHSCGPNPLRSNASGLRRVGNPHGGPGGKFVPPFVKKALQAQNGGDGGQQGQQHEADQGPLSQRTLELLRLEAGEPLPEELSRLDPNMIEQVCNEVIHSGGQITWDDIAGQSAAKKLIQEVVVWPMLNPHIFKGARAPPKGILLFGPPGTGKTLLGKAIASNIRASFFSISASSLTSKWIGEGEKLVRTLFAVAGWLAPSVIFIDEIDSLLSARKSDGEHEASRRLKTEMLVQMEGCDPSTMERRVLLIGATNRPEELDEAARRRMPKQLYIPLPDSDARREMVLRQLGPEGSISASLSDADVEKIVAKTDGYSGSDMKNLIQEACQGPVRDAVRAAGAGVAALEEKDLRPVVLRDIAIASKAQRASVEASEIVRYEEYNEKHGAKIVLNDNEAQLHNRDENDIDMDEW